MSADKLKTVNFAKNPNDLVLMGGFADCKSLTTIDLSKVTGGVSIGMETFRDCKMLTSVKLPKNLGYMGESAFENCTSLKSISIPGNVTNLKSTFKGCRNLKKVTLPNSLKAIYSDTFNGTSIESISIPESVTKPDSGAFAGAGKLKTVTFSKSQNVVVIYDGAFKNCRNLTSVSLPDNARVFKGAFDGCPNVKVRYKGKTYTSKNLSSLYK